MLQAACISRSDGAARKRRTLAGRCLGQTGRRTTPPPQRPSLSLSLSPALPLPSEGVPWSGLLHQLGVAVPAEERRFCCCELFVSMLLGGSLCAFAASKGGGSDVSADTVIRRLQCG